MNKSLLFIATVALTLVLAPARVEGFQTPVSVEQANAGARNSAAASAETVDKAVLDIPVSLNKAETATKEAIESGNSAAKAAWKKDVAKDTEKK